MKYEKPNLHELTIGVEIEVQLKQSSDLSRNDIAYSLQTDILKDFVICKEDASIGYGFEIVSSPATFDYHKHKWNDFFNSEEIFGSNCETRCTKAIDFIPTSLRPQINFCSI